MRLPTLLRCIGCCLLTVAATACSVSPKPLTQDENTARAVADRAFIREAQPVPTGPVTLSEAMARALSYNLDARLQIFEQALQSSQLDVNRFDLLPRLTANAGYTVRDRELVTSSENFRTGAISEDETISVDQQRATADLTFTWSVLDFGVSYFQAKQQADRVLVAQERRRRVINNIFQEVRLAYWQVVAAERVLPQLAPVLNEARRALALARDVERRRLQPPLDVLRFQRGVLDVIAQLEAIQAELAIARARLSQLMGLPPGTPFTVVVPDAKTLNAPQAPVTIEQMEEAALLLRPELREEAYNTRIAQLEGRRGILRLFPNLTFLGSLNADSNSFLLFPYYAEAGARLSWNLVGLASIPSVLRLAESQREVAQTRRLAVTMAVLAQVQVSAQSYVRSRTAYLRALDVEEVEQRISSLSTTQRDANAGTDLDSIRDRANAAIAQLLRDRSYADLQNALAIIFVTMGLDLMPETVEGRDIAALAAAIQARESDLLQGRLNLPTLPAGPSASASPEPSPPPVTAQASDLGFFDRVIRIFSSGSQAATTPSDGGS